MPPSPRRASSQIVANSSRRHVGAGETNRVASLGRLRRYTPAAGLPCQCLPRPIDPPAHCRGAACSFCVTLSSRASIRLPDRGHDSRSARNWRPSRKPLDRSRTRNSGWPSHDSPADRRHTHDPASQRGRPTAVIVAHVGSIAGGAGVAALKVHRALRDSGVTSRFVAIDPTGTSAAMTVAGYPA
jgi:hypothetical protein